MPFWRRRINPCAAWDGRSGGHRLALRLDGWHPGIAHDAADLAEQVVEAIAQQVCASRRDKADQHDKQSVLDHRRAALVRAEAFNQCKHWGVLLTEIQTMTGSLSRGFNLSISPIIEGRERFGVFGLIFWMRHPAAEVRLLHNSGFFEPLRP